MQITDEDDADSLFKQQSLPATKKMNPINYRTLAICKITNRIIVTLSIV